MKTERMKTDQKIRVNFTTNRLYIGLAMALISLLLCFRVGTSRPAKLVLPVSFLVLASVELECCPKAAERLISLWSAASTFATLFLTQLLLNERALTLGIQQILLGMICCGAVLSGLYVFTANLRIATIAGMSVMMFLTAVNYFVFKFRGSELSPWDFLSIGTALGVVGQYHFSIDAPFCYAVVLAAAYCFAGSCIKGDHARGGVGKRLGSGAIEICLVICLVWGGSNVTPYSFRQVGSVLNGFLLNFVLQIEGSIVNAPEEYDPDLVAVYEEQYEEEPVQAAAQEAPDILVIMNESFADLRVLGSELRTNVEVMPFYDSLTENVIKGYALTSVFGGNTANSEYEFLTGHSMGFLPSGSIAYQQFIQRDTSALAWRLKQMGYTCIAAHPNDGTNWLRSSVYPHLGFDEMYFMEDFPQEDMLRDFVSDRELYAQMIEWYEQHGREENIFLFGITMQNHSPYTYDADDFRNTVCLQGYSGEYPDAEQYLTLLQHSDEALSELIQYFENVEQDVVILLFGDHLPKLDEAFYEEVHGGPFDTLEEQMLQYTVPFLIWANYDIEESDVELTSLNFLTTYLYEAAGLETPPYVDFLSDIQQTIPAMNRFGYYSETQKCIVPYADAAGEETEALSRYEILQYNCLFDENHLSGIFFPLG